MLHKRLKLAQVDEAKQDVLSLYPEVVGDVEDVLVQSSHDGVCGTHLQVDGRRYFFPFSAVPAVIDQKVVINIADGPSGPGPDHALGIQLLNETGEVTMRFVHEDSENDPCATQLFVE